MRQNGTAGGGAGRIKTRTGSPGREVRKGSHSSVDVTLLHAHISAKHGPIIATGWPCSRCCKRCGSQATPALLRLLLPYLRPAPKHKQLLLRPSHSQITSRPESLLSLHTEKHKGHVMKREELLSRPL